MTKAHKGKLDPDSRAAEVGRKRLSSSLREHGSRYAKAPKTDNRSVVSDDDAPLSDEISNADGHEDDTRSHESDAAGAGGTPMAQADVSVQPQKDPLDDRDATSGRRKPFDQSLGSVLARDRDFGTIVALAGNRPFTPTKDDVHIVDYRRAVGAFCAARLSAGLDGFLRVEGLFRTGDPLFLGLPGICTYLLAYATSEDADTAISAVQNFDCDYQRRKIPLSAVKLADVHQREMTTNSVEEEERGFTAFFAEIEQNAIPLHVHQSNDSEPRRQPDITDSPMLEEGEVATDDDDAVVETFVPPQPSNENIKRTSNHWNIPKHTDKSSVQNGSTFDSMELFDDLTTAVKLKDLTTDERMLQTRYWGISRDEDLAICPICSLQGHMRNSCPSRTCMHCNIVDSHFSSACPSRKKCSKCRERGHDTLNCPSKLLRTAADGFECDICLGKHLEENCSWLWRTFNPKEARELHKVDWMPVSCYDCGSSQHWGDDCLGRPRLNPQSSTNNIFSAAYANHFLTETSFLRHQKQEHSIRGRAKKNETQEVEELEDSSKFYGKKVNTANSARPSMAVNTSNAATSGVDDQQSNNSRRNYRFMPPPDQAQRNAQDASIRPIELARTRHVQSNGSRQFGANPRGGGTGRGGRGGQGARGSRGSRYGR